MVLEYVVSDKVKNEYFYSLLLKTFLGHFVPLGIFFLVFNSTPFKAEISFAVFCGWFLFFATPTIVLFYNHWKKSRNSKFVVNNNEFTYLADKESDSFYVQDVKSVTLNLSPPSYDKRTDFLFFGKYFYTTIQLKSKKTINVSCLVLDEVENIFPKWIIKRNKKGFPLIP